MPARSVQTSKRISILCIEEVKLCNPGPSRNMTLNKNPSLSLIQIGKAQWEGNQQSCLCQDLSHRCLSKIRNSFRPRIERAPKITPWATNQIGDQKEDRRKSSRRLLSRPKLSTQRPSSHQKSSPISGITGESGWLSTGTVAPHPLPGTNALLTQLKSSIQRRMSR